jgi:hypothetical protein
LGNFIIPPSLSRPVSQPGRARICGRKRQHLHRLPAGELLGAVARVALAVAGHRCVDRHDQRVETGEPRALDAGHGHRLSADDVELIPRRRDGRGANVLEPAARQRGQDVARARDAGRARRHLFAARVEEPRAADRREKKGQIERGAEDRRSQVALRRRDGVPRAERHVVEDSAVFAQRDFVVGPAVDVVEHHARQPAFGQQAQVGDVDGAFQTHPQRKIMPDIRCIECPGLKEASTFSSNIRSSSRLAR